MTDLNVILSRGPKPKLIVKGCYPENFYSPAISGASLSAQLPLPSNIPASAEPPAISESNPPFVRGKSLQDVVNHIFHIFQINRFCFTKLGYKI